jgi:hypothetical protein
LAGASADRSRSDRRLGGGGWVVRAFVPTAIGLTTTALGTLLPIVIAGLALLFTFLAVRGIPALLFCRRDLPMRCRSS